MNSQELLRRVETFTPHECSGEIHLQQYHDKVIGELFSRRIELRLTLQQTNALAEIHSRIILRVQELTKLLNDYERKKKKENNRG